MATYHYRNKLKLPEAHGIKTLEIGSSSVYLRWAFLSTHSLSTHQLQSLIFELKTTDNSINAECRFKKSRSNYEYKARLNGLRPNTKYRFIIRCKLTYHHEIIYSEWSNRIEFETKPNRFSIITDEKELEIASLKHELTEYKHKYNILESKNKELTMRLNKLLPPHLSWNYKKITEWILRIEGGIFKPYKQTLLKNLKKEDIDGRCLCQIDGNDLTRFGITKFAHKKILISHLKKLTENDRLPQFTYDPELTHTVNYKEDADKSRDSLDDDEEQEDKKNNDDDNYLNTRTPKLSLPSQLKHFPTPPSLPSDNSNNNNKQNKQNKHNKQRKDKYNKKQNDEYKNKSNAKYKNKNKQIHEYKTNPNAKYNNKQNDKHKKTDKDKDKDKYNEIKSMPLIPKLSDIGTFSCGLPESVKEMLVSSPSMEALKKWTYKNGVLSIKVIKATNVDNMDEDEGPGSASDPYVEIELKGHYKKEKTRVISNDANPVWNERFQLFPENPKKDILKCKIWDKDTWTFDDKIGSVHIPVLDVLNANGYINKAFDIKGSQCGAKLYLELKYKELGH